MTNREEYLAWCKKRAHWYLSRGDVQNAIISMLSDLDKHDQTKVPPGSALDSFALSAAIRNDVTDARRFIDGFN